MKRHIIAGAPRLRRSRRVAGRLGAAYARLHGGLRHGQRPLPAPAGDAGDVGHVQRRPFVALLRHAALRGRLRRRSRISRSRAFRSRPTPRWSRRRRIISTIRGMSIRLCCRSSGSPMSTCSATACASTSRPPRPSPITSLRLTRTSRRGPTGLPTGRATYDFKLRARQPLGLRTGRAAAASPS